MGSLPNLNDLHLEKAEKRAEERERELARERARERVFARDNKELKVEKERLPSIFLQQVNFLFLLYKLNLFYILKYFHCYSLILFSLPRLDTITTPFASTFTDIQESSTYKELRCCTSHLG